MEPNTEVACAAADGQVDGPPGVGLSLTQTHLTVRDIMNEDVVTACPQESILTVVKRMSHHSVSCVVVVSGDTVTGMLTQKDLLSGVVHEQEGYCQLPVAERMSSPTVVAAPDLPVREAARLLKARQIKHLPIVADRRLVGIVTQTDITRGLVYLTALQRVSEVMSSHVATVGPEATAADAARAMWTHNVTGVVVMLGNQAMGVVSQKDIMIRVTSMQKNPACTPVVDIMSTPVLPIPPHYSIFLASRLMDRMHVHRLVVQDDRQICGIVSQTDILKAVERRLAEQEKHRLFLACADIPMFMLDARATVTYVNAALLRLFGFETHAAIAGSSLADDRFWDTPADTERLEATLGRQESAMLGLVLRTSEGRRERVVALLTVGRNACDEVRSWQGVLWNATSRRKRPGERWPLPGDQTAGEPLSTVLPDISPAT
jgi:CBS domain-containing protein